MRRIRRASQVLGILSVVAGCGGDPSSEAASTSADAGAGVADTVVSDALASDAVTGGGSSGADSLLRTEQPPSPDFGGPSYACIAAACSVDACVAASGCALALDCVADCDTAYCAEQCRLTAAPPFKSPVTKLFECAVVADCFSGGGGFPGCGDGACKDGETRLVCPQDCDLTGKPDAIYSCITERCPTTDCEGEPACNTGIQCLATCTDSKCSSACVDTQKWYWRSVLYSLVSCAAQKECLPDEAVPVCGNANCDIGESMLNCPEDCGEPPANYVCIVDGCEPWPCPNIGSCDDALMCLSDCVDSACSQACIAPVHEQLVPLLTDTVACAVDQGCLPEAAALPPGPVCGDAQCEGDEATTCPDDCTNTCVPDCTDRACGADGCDGSCGTCDESMACQEGTCIAL